MIDLDDHIQRIIRRIVDILSNTQNVTDLRIVIDFDNEDNLKISYTVDEDITFQDEEDDDA